MSSGLSLKPEAHVRSSIANARHPRSFSNSNLSCCALIIDTVTKNLNQVEVGAEQRVRRNEEKVYLPAKYTNRTNRTYKRIGSAVCGDTAYMGRTSLFTRRPVGGELTQGKGVSCAFSERLPIFGA